MTLVLKLKSWLPGPIAALLRPGWRRLNLWLEQRRYQFQYGRAWYESGYHVKLDEVSDGQADTLDYWEARGYRARLMRVCEELDRHIDLRACGPYLEVACMYGKTAFWLAERYPQLGVWTFDFSERFVEHCKAHNPIGDRLHIWQGECTRIRNDEQSFDAFFDFATCIDVTEHLPDDVYRGLLRELARVIKPGGHLLLMQGNTVQVEHIHIIPESHLVGDLEQVGFTWLVTLPERHHLFVR
jgi:SAM-dependent methyltransferase